SSETQKKVCLVDFQQTTQLHPAIKPEQARALLEEELEGKPGEDAPDAPKAQTAAGAKALEAYTVDLTKQAADGKIDEIRGRDPEIRQVVDILTRRRQNNPILTGEAGVGKTAAVEGFALKLARGEVPETLKDCRLLALDLGLLQAGAGVKGEFERRLKEVIDAVKGSPKPIILFIDEAHNLVGAGGSEGQGDAANLMKPALARGELRTIAATTWAEYKKYFEKDAALARRFQVVKIEEPGEESAIDMLHAISGAFAEHHGTRIRDEALRAAVRLSNRYITGRQLPEKAVGVLDTACARVSLSKATEPGVLEDAKMRLRAIERRIETLEREQAGGIDHAATLQTLGAERDEINERVGLLTEKLEAERAVIEKIYEVRGRAEELAEPGEEGAEPDEAEQKAAIEELNALREELSTLQGEEPLSHHEVDEDAVASVVAAWTGIPVGRMVTDDINAVLRLKEQLCERVVGQDHALEQIAQKVRTSRAQLTDPDKPIGVFLMVGTSGVGKTETGLALADLLYGGEQNLTTINMSEFKEEHKVSLLMGSPPGYV
ncbi:MAG: AAA family ATPase, partial [Planctomycetota bacterium]